MSECASYFERKTLPAEVAQTEPRTQEPAESYLIPLGITSLLDAPILFGGELVGLVCLEHTGPPREWSTGTCLAMPAMPCPKGALSV